jgi:hypothetical protein
MSEFDELAATTLKKAKLGSFFVIPLKWEKASLSLKPFGSPVPVTTLDLTDTVRKMFNRSDDFGLGKRYLLSLETVLKYLLPAEAAGKELADFAVDSVEVGTNGSHRIRNGTVESSVPADAKHFSIHEAWLYVYQTKVAFLCPEIHYTDMAVMQNISNLGYTDLSSRYFACFTDGSCMPFAFDRKLDEMCRSLGFGSFTVPDASPLIEAFLYNVSVSGKRFVNLDTCRQIVFNQHLMDRLDLPLEDASEEDIHYVYSVKDQELGSYRWACCVTSQTISYAIGREDCDLDDEMHQQAEDGLPLVTMALYQKYSCMVFSDEIIGMENKNMNQLGQMKHTLLKFKAFGTVDPALLSRWYNVRQIYNILLEFGGVKTAIDAVGEKISILVDHQNAIRTQRTNTLMGLITVFGVVSILASILDIISLLESGGSVFWQIGFCSMLTMVIITIVALFGNRKIQ